LEFEKGEGTAFVPSKDFSVEDGLVAEKGCRIGDFREGGGDAFQVSRKNAGGSAVRMNLSTDAVEFRLHPECLATKSGDDRRGVRLGDSEHAFDWVKNSESGFVKAMIACESGDLAEVAFEHVGLTHSARIAFESGSERFFEEAFLEADSEVAGEDFYEILGGGNWDFTEEGFEEGGFGRGAFGGAKSTKEKRYFGKGGV
jgi:hypothetical protein